MGIKLKILEYHELFLRTVLGNLSHVKVEWPRLNEKNQVDWIIGSTYGGAWGDGVKGNARNHE